MISDIMPPVNEDEEIDAHTMFGDLRKNLVKEFASEISGYTDNFERLKVYLRVRPFTLEEIAANKESCLTFEDENYVNAIAPKESHTFKNTNKNIHKFKFSKIFKEDTDQSEFYDNTVKKLVDDFLIGQNCLVFAYGVTNAGKSYTVQGNPKNPGVLPRTLETIFNHVNGKQWKGLNLKPKMFLDVVKLSPNSEQEERNKKDLLLRMASWDDSDSSSIFTNSSRESCPLEIIEKSQESDVNDEELLHSTHLNETAYGDQIKYSVWISFAEVYNEQVFDLLEAPNLKKRKLLKLGEDKHGNPYIRGLTEVNVSSSEEALKLMTIGQKNLRKASTKLNHNSSRSHCIFNIKLLRVVNRENPSVAKVTTLSLCDLAGSERACKTNSTGDRLKEAGNINTSLLTLGRCIETMRSNQIKKDLLPRMIPYRESKLTRLFQGFFSGRGKAVMIVNVSKCSNLYDETLHVFKFSAIAKQVLIQQKVEKPISLTISPVLPVKPLTHLERASIPWADDVHEISRVNYSNRLSTADETMEEEELTEREKALIDIIDNCKKAITHLKESLAKEKKERMLDEIYIRDEITKELMEEFVMIEKKYDEKIQMNRHLAEEAADERIAKLIETLNPNKKRSHDEVESEEEMVPLHVFQESQEKIKQCEVQIQELTQRLESTKTQMRRMTSDHSKLACENTCLQFQVSDMLQIPMPQKIPQCESLSDNLEHANVLSKLTSMLKSTQEKLKEKQSAVDELEEQLQEAGETFLQNQKQMEALKEMVESLKESNKKPAECEACKSRNETSWQLNPELKTQAGTANGVRSLRSHRNSLHCGSHLTVAGPIHKETNGLPKQQRSPWLSCMGKGVGKKRKSNGLLPRNPAGVPGGPQFHLPNMVVEKADESRVLRVMLNTARGLVPTPTKTSLLRSKKFPSLKDVNCENSPSSSPAMNLRGPQTKLTKGGKKKDVSPGVKRRMLAPICTNLIADKKLKKQQAVKGRRRSSLLCSKRASVSFSSEQEGLCRPISNDHSYQKQLTDFEERERALINGYNAEISKYKNQLSQLRLQLAHTKHSPLHLSPTKSTTEKTKENNSNQSQIKHYLLRQVKRLQEELDKNSQSVAEVHQALELKRAAEIDLEQRLAHETAGHRQAKVLISELKAKVKRLGERCRSASFEAEKTFAAIESELSLIENQRVSIPTELSDLESFESAKENSFDLGKGGAGNIGEGGKENQLVKMKVFIGGESTGEQTVKKKKKKVLGENGSLRLDPECLEQKIISKNMEIVRLQEKLLVQSKLEHDLKDLSGKNQELVTQLTEMSNLQAELKKKALLIRNLEEKLKDTEVLEVEIESQTAVIQHLQAAVNERTKLLAEIQNGPEKGVSKGNDSPVSERKLEEMEMVVADLREMVDKITKELSKKEEKIQALTNEKKNSQKSLKDNVETLKREISSLELEVKGFKKEKEEQKVLKNGMEKELESMKTENKRICESLNSVKKELESSQKEIKEMNDLKNSLLKKVEEFKVENKELNELKNSLLKKFEEFKLENKENKNMKNSLIDNLEAIKLEFETVSNLKNNLVKDLETSKVESKRILDLKNSLTKELENLKSENESVLSQNNSLINELKSLKEEKEKMDGLKNSMAKDFKNLEEEKERILERKSFLEEKLENVEKEKEGNFEDKNLLETELKNLKDECKKMSDLKDSLDKENQVLKEQHKTILDEKKSLQSELDLKNLEILSLTESQKSKELANEKLSTKTKNDFNKSLALAKMAQKELEENLEAKKKELKAKGMELTKISKLLEEKNEENAKLESKIIDLCKEKDFKPSRIGNNMEMDSNLEPMGEAIAKDSKALLSTEKKESLVVAESQIDVLVNKETQSSMIVHRVGKEKGEECKSEIADDGSKGVLVVEEKSKTPEEEISELKKDLDDSIQAREKLLLEISSLVSLLSEKDLQIAELTTIGKSNGDEDVLPKIAKEGTDNNPSVVTDQPKSNVGPEEHLKEGKSLRVEDYQRISCVKMVTTTATQTSENETNEKENFGNKSEEKEEEKEFCVEKRKCGNERKLEDFDELQTELEKVRMSLEEERTLNDALQFDLAAANAELDQLKTDYDHEKNISFNLKYELNDVKGSLSEALSCFNQLSQTKTDSKIENEKMKLSNESNKKNLEDLEPEKMQLVEDLQKQKETWQAKYEEVSLQLISERQKLLDARQSQSENFYLRRDNEELKKQLTSTEKQLQEVQSRQEIQLITMETEQMTQKLIEDRKKSEEQHLRDDLDHLQKELGNAHEKMKSYEELEVELIQLRSEVAHLKEEAVQKESVKHSPDKGENSPRDGPTLSSNNLNEESIGKQTEVINKESGHYLPDKGETSPRDGPTVSSNNLNENSIGKQTEVINKESGHYLPDKGETSPRDGPTVSSNNVNEESIAKQTEALKSDVEKKCEHCEMNRNSALEKMHEEIEVLSKELATAQKETDELRAKVEAKNKLEKEESLLTGTSLIDTKIGSNRQLRREKIQAEQSKMEAEFKLKITQEEVRSLTQRLEKFEGDGSVSNGQDENSRRELEAAKREIGRLESKLKENEERISKTGNGQMDGTNKVQHLQEELKESVDKLKNEKEKVLKLEDDVSQKTCVIDILRDSLKEQEEVMVSFEKLILQKDEAIKRLNNELSAKKMSVKEEKGNAIGGSPSKNKSLETERLKTVVSNQTETIQILSERNNQQELMGKSIRDDLQNLKMSMTIITAERDSLRKRLHLVETSCKCNKDKEKTLDVKSKEGLSDVETLKISVTNSVSSSDDKFWHQQKALVTQSINKFGARRRIELENSLLKSPSMSSSSSSQKTTNLKRSSGPTSSTSSCIQKKACLSPEVDELSPLKKEELTSNSSLVKEEYREIDVTPPVATKALKKNRKRKPLDIQAQNNLLNSSKLSISTKSLSLCHKANVSDEEQPQGQELPAETPRRLFRRSKSVALKKIHTMSSSNAKETSPMNKKKKSMEHESESVTEEQTSENSQNKGKTALSRFKTLTNSFRSPSFRGAKNMLTSPRTWSLKETPKKSAHVSPNVRCSPSTRPAISSTSVSKTKTIRLTASEADDKSHRELRDILSSTTTHQRKRRLYKEEIIGPMSYESQIVKTRTMTTVRPKDDVFSIVKQQLKGLHK